MLGIAGFAGQLIVPELVNIPAFCFPGDLFQHRAGKNFRPEHGRNFFFSNLLDEPHHLAGAGIGKIGRLDSADHLEAIAPGKVRPGIMVPAFIKAAYEVKPIAGFIFTPAVVT